MTQEPQTRRAIREANRGARTAGLFAAPFVAAGVALVLLAAGAWFAKGLITGSTPSGSRSIVAGSPGSASPSGSRARSMTTTAPAIAPSSHATSTPAATPPPKAAPISAATSSCRTAWGLRSTARDTAAASLRQWQTHLEIMNQLQKGKISLATAKARWPSTIAGAEANVALFRKADRALAASKASCAPRVASEQGAAADALRACATSTRTVDSALAEAREAIDPWETHLEDTSHFQGGGMSPDAAEAAWRVLWKRGVATMPSYLAAEARAERARCSLLV